MMRDSSGREVIVAAKATATARAPPLPGDPLALRASEVLELSDAAEAILIPINSIYLSIIGKKASPFLFAVINC